MRLTLRTLLAYLDDTLEPNEIKEIGQKVAESDAAQELVARIKQVTRRRRLTTPPPAGPNAKFDANVIAEYLDNELTHEMVAELEKTCLESDVHLAEVASCHQILTLVLGEPALVPPTARERMYGLVKGREAIPFRKARGRDGLGADDIGDDPLLPGLPSSRGWLLWVLPLAAVLVLAALAIAVWQALPDAHPTAVAVVQPNPPPAASSQAPPVAPVTPVAGPAKDDTPTPPVVPPMNPPPNPPTNPPMNPPAPPDANPPPDERPQPPSKVRAVVGSYEVPPRAESSILVQRQAGQAGWMRLAPGKSEVSSTDDLVSLPGYNSELALGKDHGVHLLMHGHVPQFTVHPIMEFLMESAVRLHQPAPGFDADLTLDRGRIFLSSRRANGPVKVRLRFAGEVWDLTLLDPDTEVGVDLIQAYLGDVNYLDEAPFRSLDLFVFSGRIGAKIDDREYSNLPTRAHFLWDNKGPGAVAPQSVSAKDWPLVQTIWSKTPPPGATQAERADITQMIAALDSLSKLMTNKSVEDALQEARGSTDNPMLRLLAVYSFGAIDAVDRVLDVLCTHEAEAEAPDRYAAVATLRRWIGRDKANGLLLYNEAKQNGLLIDGQHLHHPEAKTVFELLHDFPTKVLDQPATLEKLVSKLLSLLRDPRLPIRELAYWHLRRLPGGATAPEYNAGWGEDQRNSAVDQWRKKLIDDGRLPKTPPPA